MSEQKQNCARIASVSTPYPEALKTLIAQAVPSGMAPFALFTTLAREPRVFDAFLGRGFLGKGHLSGRERLLVIGRTTALCGAEYEWGIHMHFFGGRAGLSDPEFYALVHSGADSECWDEDDRLLINICDALHDSSDIGDQLWKALKDRYTDEAALEIIMLAGTYRSISYMTNALRLPLEPFARRFPPVSPSPVPKKGEY
jgi:alkylhydroperoxidase family enzyme